MLQSKATKQYNVLSDAEEGLIPTAASVSGEEDHKSRKCCKDPLFAVIFLAGVGLMVYSLVVNKEGLEKEWMAETAEVRSGFKALNAAKALGASFGVAAVFSALWLLFMRFCVKFTIYGLFILTIVAEIAGASALFYFAGTTEASTGHSWLIGFGVLVVLLLGYTIWVVWSFCNRVALAASLIKVSGGVLKQCPMVFVLHAFLAVCKFFWVIFCGSVAWCMLGSGASHSFWISLGMAFMGYWGLEILSNIALVTSYGTFGQWFYGRTPSTCMPLCRATTSDFGSICFGSLLVALVETAHDFLRAVQKKGYIPSWVMCCVDRFMAATLSAMEYLNMYGFVQVAIHDESFMQGAKRAMSFLKYKGLTALVNDMIVSRMAYLGSLAGGLLCGAAPVILNRYYHHADVTKLSLDGNQETTLALAGFMLGFFVVYTLIAPIHAMATALLVCFAEHPEVLANDHEDEYKTLIEPWEAVYGADFVDKAATAANMRIEDNGLLRGGASKPTLHPLAGELEQLVSLHQSGQLTDEEFASAKSKLLS